MERQPPGRPEGRGRMEEIESKREGVWRARIKEERKEARGRETDKER